MLKSLQLPCLIGPSQTHSMTPPHLRHKLRLLVHGKYINKLDLGLLKANLLAEYKHEANTKINVKFVDITFQLGPFKINRVRAAVVTDQDAPM